MVIFCLLFRTMAKEQNIDKTLFEAAVKLLLNSNG
jgi:hypothetical protein